MDNENTNAPEGEVAEATPATDAPVETPSEGGETAPIGNTEATDAPAAEDNAVAAPEDAPEGEATPE